MCIFSSMFKTRNKPKDSTAGLEAASASAWMFRFGGSSSNKLVTERSSMQMAAVYACVRVLSEAAGSRCQRLPNRQAPPDCSGRLPSCPLKDAWHPPPIEAGTYALVIEGELAVLCAYWQKLKPLFIAAHGLATLA